MIEDADETQLLYAVANRGVSFIDASTIANIPLTAPTVAPAPSLQPSEGPFAGGTPVILAGQNFSGPVQVKIGSQLAANPTVSGSSQIQLVSPPTGTHYAADACGVARESGHSHFCACGFHNFLQRFSILAKRPFPFEAGIVQISDTSSDGTAQNAAITVVQLAAVPLGIGTIQPSTISAAGRGILTIRGSGFVNGVGLTINGKTATVTFKGINTLSVTVPTLAPGPQRITISNPDGERVSLDAAITAN